jgi:hypothetical protein
MDPGSAAHRRSRAKRDPEGAAQHPGSSRSALLITSHRSSEFAGRRGDSIFKSWPLDGREMSAEIWSPPMWVLLLLPFVGLLWVPFYNFQEPALFGFPFFYWYQLAWVPITSVLIWLVYRRRAPDETP